MYKKREVRVAVRGGEDGEGSGGWWSLKVVAVVLAAAGVAVEGDGDVNGGVGVMVWHGDAATMVVMILMLA
ncbi:hypothetical protein Tco_0181381, partial [Tanacetum coccineum]